MTFSISFLRRPLVILTLCLLCFGAGWLIRGRGVLSDSPDNITVVGSNGAIQNSLSNMKIIDILGVTELDGEGTQYRQFGQLYYFAGQGGTTEIHVRMSGVPETISNADESGPTKAIPRTLDIKLAYLTVGAEDYDYDLLGQIKLTPDETGVLRGQYSTILDPVTDFDGTPIPALAEVQRIVFDAEQPGTNIFADENADLPPRVRQRPAPFFWAVVR